MPRSGSDLSLVLGPTPLRQLELSSPTELWVKDDGLTEPSYGGNKVRKLGPILDLARQRGKRRIVTLGGAGSHHVLATTYFAARHGLRTLAVLCPQPWTEHAEETLRTALAWGLEVVPASGWGAVPGLALGAAGRDDLLLPMGGWGIPGSSGYVLAVGELVGQLRAGAAPEPDLIVVALGSGGTAAGILAGLARWGRTTPVLAVSVAVGSAALARWLVMPLARRLAAANGTSRPPSTQLRVDVSEFGPGYGCSTPASARAIAVGHELGMTLDPTYTGKAFAAALRAVGFSTPSAREPIPDLPPRRVLYWHTLSAAPLRPLRAAAPGPGALPASLRSLLPRT